MPNGILGQNLQVEETATEKDHWILYIRVGLGTKFQLRLTILSFWTKFGLSLPKKGILI